MHSRGGPHFGGLYVDEFQKRTPFWGCMLMNSRGRPPFQRGGPPLGTISMDLAVYIGYSEPTGQETGESHLCAVSQRSAKSTRTESKISEENQLQQACVKTSNQIIGAKQINKRQAFENVLKTVRLVLYILFLYYSDSQKYSIQYTLQSLAGPVQGQNRVFPVQYFHTGKNLFSLQGSQLMKTGFSLLEILHRETPVFITGMGLQ